MKIEDKIKQIREAVANYIDSEGCSCCRDYDKHLENRAILGKLLKVPKFKDDSGHDFYKYKTIKK